MESPTPTFPPVNYSKYIWRASPTDPTFFQREAFGGEYLAEVWNRVQDGDNIIFLFSDVTIPHAPPLAEFVDRVRDAWTALRFTMPIIAASATSDKAGNSILTYRAAKDAEDALAWARRTVVTHPDAPSTDDLRRGLRDKSLPDEHGDLAFLHVVHRSDISYTFLLHTSHVPFDGNGVKIVMSDFFKTLARYLTDASPAPAFSWGTEAANLLPSASEVLVAGEEREGPTYANSLASIMGDLAASTTRMHGYKPRMEITKGATGHFSYTFDVEESAKLVAAARARGHTITQIAHAAVAITTYFDNSPTDTTAPDASVVFWSVRDCRDRLREPYSKRDGYPGYCLGMTPVQIRLSDLALYTDETELLYVTASMVKAQYAQQRAYPSLLAIAGQQIDGLMAGFRAGAPPPPPWYAPWFIGDGLGTKYLDPVYKDHNGQTVIEVADAFLTVNRHDPGPAFRVHSWNEKLTFSADFNENALPKDVVRSFFDKAIALLRLLA